MEFSQFLPWISLLVGLAGRVFIPWLAIRQQDPENAAWSWPPDWVRPISWPRGVSLRLALSCRSSSRYSARDVNIR